MPVLVRHHWTRAEVLAIPDDGKRRELVDGELLVSPAPRGRHQIGVDELLLVLAPYVQQHRLGRAITSPADLDLQSGQLVQPDLFVGGMVDGRRPVEWEEYGIPLLVVEVLSSSTADYDRGIKRRLYQHCGVPAYWIIDLDARIVEAWTPRAIRPQILTGKLTWQPDPAIEPLVIDLTEYFRDVWAE